MEKEVWEDWYEGRILFYNVHNRPNAQRDDDDDDDDEIFITALTIDYLARFMRFTLKEHSISAYCSLTGTLSIAYIQYYVFVEVLRN
jgi:hypothetical protein